MRVSNRARVAAALVALTVGSLVATAAPASAGKPPLGLSASVSLTSSGATSCSAVVNVQYNYRPQPIDSFVYTAVLGTPTPSGAITTFRLTGHAKDSLSFTFAPGDTVQFQIDAKANGATVSTVTPNSVSC